MNSIYINTSGTQILTALCRERSVHILDAAEVSLRGSLCYHEGSVNAVAVSKSNQIVTAGEDGKLCVWNPLEEQQLEKRHDSAVSSLAMRSDGKLLLAGDQKGKLSLWIKNEEGGFRHHGFIQVPADEIC